MSARREKLLEMLKSSPEDPFLHYGLAMEDRADGDLEAALRGLDSVLELDGDYVAAYFHKGQVLAELGQRDAAEQILRSGIETARRVNDTHALEEMTGFLEGLK